MCVSCSRSSPFGIRSLSLSSTGIVLSYVEGRPLSDYVLVNLTLYTRATASLGTRRPPYVTFYVKFAASKFISKTSSFSSTCMYASCKYMRHTLMENGFAVSHYRGVMPAVVQDFLVHTNQSTKWHVILTIDARTQTQTHRHTDTKLLASRFSTACKLF